MNVLSSSELKLMGFKDDAAINMWVNYCLESKLAGEPDDTQVNKLLNDFEVFSNSQALDLFPQSTLLHSHTCFPPNLDVDAERSKNEFLLIMICQLEALTENENAPMPEGQTRGAIRERIAQSKTRITNNFNTLTQVDRIWSSNSSLTKSLIGSLLSGFLCFTLGNNDAELGFQIIFAVCAAWLLLSVGNRYLANQASRGLSQQHNEVVHPNPAGVFPGNGVRLGELSVGQEQKRDDVVVQVEGTADGLNQPLLKPAL